jgi:hypothetical protein
MTKSKHVAVLAALGIAACQAEPSTATANIGAPAETAPAEIAAGDAGPAAPPATAAGVRLSGPASAEDIAAVQEEAGRQEMTRVKIATAQSFSVKEGGRTVATLVTGEGNMPGAELNGCFVATKQGNETMLIPTVGYNNYELEPCGGPLGVGVLSSGNPVKLGVVFRSFSREAEETIPIVIDWDRSNNTLLIDEAASRRALDGGAKTIAQMRKIVR